jgi:hypothetical protein
VLCKNQQDIGSCGKRYHAGYFHPAVFECVATLAFSRQPFSNMNLWCYNSHVKPRNTLSWVIFTQCCTAGMRTSDSEVHLLRVL